MDKTTAVKQIPVYNLLTDGQKEYVSKRSDIQRFPKRETISGLITSCLGPFLIPEGEVRAVMDDENFREITLFRLFRGDTALLSAACVLEHITFDIEFVVETDSVLPVTPSAVIKKIMEENLAVLLSKVPPSFRIPFCLI